MTLPAAAKPEDTLGLAPFSLKGAPSFIEVQFPVGRLSAETYKERKAGAGQTLTALGSYWKGRKPLILCRAAVLGTLLPATADPAADLDLFLKLMGMDDAAFGRRFDGSASEFARQFPPWADLVTEERGRRRAWREDLAQAERGARLSEAFASLPYAERLKLVRRPEECDATLLDGIWPQVNRHLGTTVKACRSSSSNWESPGSAIGRKWRIRSAVAAQSPLRRRGSAVMFMPRT
jgi:putative DNA methylase